MARGHTLIVEKAEAGQRLDRYLRRHFPGLRQGRLEKLLRKGDIRVGGGKVKSCYRVASGETVSTPPPAMLAAESGQARAREEEPLHADEVEWLRSMVLDRRGDLVALAKPAGIAVQGGTGTARHIDRLLPALQETRSAQRPRLVHRLDRDTSGVLVVALTRQAAAEAAEAFKRGHVRKTYWALAAGKPHLPLGTIDVALAKQPGRDGRDMMAPQTGPEGQKAVTHYRRIDHAGDAAAWLALRPETGRTHQLRAHCAAIGHPILGDGKYGERGRDPFDVGALQLHARALALPAGKGFWQVNAPLPGAQAQVYDALGFDPAQAPDDPFEDLT